MTTKRCPLGRPMYRNGEVPDGLATVTQLALRRRRPAPGQEPVATLFYHGNQHTELYRVDETEAMPALSPGRQARYDGIRTCLRCRLRRDTPWEPAPRSKRRVCPQCAEAEAEASWWQHRNQARAAAAAWAAGVLSDPDAVLICVRDVDHLVLAAYAVLPAGRGAQAAGTVVLDAKLRHNERDFDHPGGRPDTWTDDVQGFRAVAPQIRELSGRRMVAWNHWNTAPYGLAWNMRGLLGDVLDLEVSRGPYDWKPGTTGDELSLWYAEWLGVRAGTGSWRYDRNIRSQTLPEATGDQADPRAAVTRMYELLRHMAVDDHPAGPPRCPQLLDGVREVCGAGGVSPDTGLCSSCSAAAPVAAGAGR